MPAPSRDDFSIRSIRPVPAPLGTPGASSTSLWPEVGPLARQFHRLLDQCFDQQVHQGIHLVLGPVPVFCTERIEGQKHRFPRQLTVARTDSTPCAWPNTPFSPRRLAHCPFLSMMTATCSGTCRGSMPAASAPVLGPHRVVFGVVIKLPSKLGFFCSPENPKRTKNIRSDHGAWRRLSVSNSRSVDPPGRIDMSMATGLSLEISA